jgi:hypothetical protein
MKFTTTHRSPRLVAATATVEGHEVELLWQRTKQTGQSGYSWKALVTCDTLDLGAAAKDHERVYGWAPYGQNGDRIAGSARPVGDLRRVKARAIEIALAAIAAA